MPQILCANCGYTVATNIEVPTSPVPELMGSNLVPSTAQTRMVYGTISTARFHISQIDDEITRLQEIIKNLRHKRVALITCSQTHFALVAPIRRLPPEILSEIFIHCMSPNSFDPIGLHRPCNLDKAPLLLGQVCSRWRSISLSTPRLWASFTLTTRPKYLKSDVVLAKTWLSRAGTCPLSIMLSSAGFYQNTMRPLMQVFALHCERWHDIYISLPAKVLCSLSPVKNRLPRLRNLRIGIGSDEIIDIFECAPQLRCIRLDTSVAPSMIKVPWNQLRYCDTGWRSAGSCIELLRLMPNLEECDMGVTAETLRDSHPPVQLPHLRSITIRVPPSDLFEKLVVPGLQEVSIIFLGPTWTATPQLTSLFSRCSIRMFSFRSAGRDRHPSDDDMISLLQMSPNLVEFALRGCCSQIMTKSFLTQFASHFVSEDSATAPWLVPMLHSMTVDYSPSDFDILEFANTIQSRMTFGIFKRVEIHYGAAADTEFFNSPVLSRLRQLRDIGLDISVLRHGKDLLLAEDIP